MRSSSPNRISGSVGRSGFSLSGYMMVYSSSFRIGFHNNLSWLMIDYCELLQLAPDQLDLLLWGMIHLLQVFYDLSDINISVEMIAGAFGVQPLSRGCRRLTLVRRMSRVKPSPVSLRTHLVPPLSSDNSLFLIYSGPARLSSDWF